MPARRRLAPLFAAAAILAAASPALGAGKVKPHPAVKGDAECASCHRTRSAKVYDAWERSPHGVALVKCVVCHGSTGADFRPRPEPTTCLGCHAAQVASLSRRAVKDCYLCHASHALTANPHR